MKHFLLFYEGGHDYTTKRAAFRADHLRHAEEAQRRGVLILGGALANPADGALLLFAADPPATAEDFARADPYVLNGAVTRWFVREWTTVVGDAAADPVRFSQGGAVQQCAAQANIP